MLRTRLLFSSLLTLIAAASFGQSVYSVTLSPSTVIGGGSVTGTVQLQAPAGPAGVSVTLITLSTAVSAPLSVMVNSGQKTASFPVSTSPVASDTLGRVGAIVGRSGAGADLLVKAGSIRTFSLTPGYINGGGTVVLTAGLDGPAPSGGAVISLSSNLANVTLPSTVTIPGGASVASVNLNVDPVPTDSVATITGTYNGKSKSNTITIKAPAMTSLTLGATSTSGIHSYTGTITLNFVAPASGLTISLSSNSGLVTVPSSVTVPGGARTVTFPVGVTSAVTDTVATVTAMLNGATKTRSMNLLGTDLVRLSFSSSTIVVGKTITGLVGLSQAAPVGGATIALTADTNVINMPKNVTVPAGALSANFSIIFSAAPAGGVANVTASYNGVSIKTTLGSLGSPWSQYHGDTRLSGQGLGSGAAGAVAWKHSISLSNSDSSPVIGSDGTIYITANTAVNAYSPSGNLLWSTDTGFSLGANVALDKDGNIYVPGGQGRVLSLNSSGALRWTQSTIGYVAGSAAVSPEGNVYFGDDNGLVYEFSSTGALLNMTGAGEEIDSAAAIGPDGTVFVWDHALGSVTAMTKDLGFLWTSRPANQGSGALNLTVSAQGEVFLSAGNNLYEFSSDGTFQGSVSSIESQGELASPAIGKDNTLFWPNGTFISAFPMSPGSGFSSKWNFEAGGNVIGTPSIASDGTIYFGANDGFFYAVTAAGNLQWKLKLDGNVTCAPAIDAAGNIYFTTDGGSLYCVH